MYYIFQFETTEGITITRGIDLSQAKKFITDVLNLKILKTFKFCNITAAYQYSKTHPFPWTYSAPRWISPLAPFIPSDPNFKNQFYPSKIPVNLTSQIKP